MKIVFWQTRRDLGEYFNVIAQFIRQPATVLCSKHSIIPSWQHLFKQLSTELEKVEAFNLVEKTLLQDKQLGSLAMRMLRLRSRWLYASDIRTLKRSKAGVVIIWNGLKYRQGLTVLAAKTLGIKIAYMENGLLPKTTVFDTKGVNANNSLPRDAKFYKALSPPRPFYFENLVTRAAVSEKLTEQQPLPQKFIFVPFQVDSDSQIICFSPWINTMGELFEYLLKNTDALPDDYAFVIKEHPSSHFNYNHLHQLQNKKIMFANTTSTQTLIDSSQAVITINSTVGIEALTLGKPVLVLGEACYAIDGLCLRATANDFADQVKHLLTFNPDVKLRENFLSYLQHDYLIPGHWSAPDNKHLKAISARLETL